MRRLFIKSTDYHKLLDYIAENAAVERFMIEEALHYINSMRCPLKHACEQLYYAIEQSMEDFAMDNDIDYASLYEEVDVEDLFWEIDEFAHAA